MGTGCRPHRANLLSAPGVIDEYLPTPEPLSELQCVEIYSIANGHSLAEAYSRWVYSDPSGKRELPPTEGVL